jgi:hypothetical protein
VSKEIQQAMKVITEAMQDVEHGSYSHAWHCNIAMACQDAILSGVTSTKVSALSANKIGNEAASRFMKTLFDVKTKK